MEQLVDVEPSSRRGLEVPEAILLSELLALLVSDHSVIFFVSLVGDEELGDIFGSVGLNLLDPVADVVEGVLIATVINQDDAHGALIVRLSDGSEPLLSCSVPHLKFDHLVVNVDRLDLEINA